MALLGDLDRPSALDPHVPRRAIAQVTALSSGEPLDPWLRVTLHFHILGRLLNMVVP